MDSAPDSDAAGLEQVDAGTWRCHGRWTVDGLGRLLRELGQQSFPGTGKLILQGGDMQAMDTAGAWLLRSLLERLQAQGRQVETEGFPEHHLDLLTRLDELAEPPVRLEGYHLQGRQHVVAVGLLHAPPHLVDPANHRADSDAVELAAVVREPVVVARED